MPSGRMSVAAASSSRSSAVEPLAGVRRGSAGDRMARCVNQVCPCMVVVLSRPSQRGRVHRSATRVASASASRPSRPVTPGARRVRTASDEIDRAPGSAARRSRTSSLPPSMIGRGPACCAPAATPRASCAAKSIETYESRLKEPDLAHPLAADAAGREVGDAARREPHARVGDVDLRREHVHADRLDRRDLRLARSSGAGRGRGSSGRRRRRCRGCARETCRAGAPR